MRALLTLLALGLSLSAKVEVVTSYAYIADLVRQVGGEQVGVTYLAKPTQDPHYVVPKPSYVAKLRRADLLVVNGGGLEVGWMPPLIRQSGNPEVHPGGRGYVDLSASVTMIEKPEVLSRAEGDVHPEGNPHFALDMAQVPRMAAAVTEGLCRVDTIHCDTYRRNEAAFTQKWKDNLARWQARLAPLKGTEVVQAHRLFDYLLLQTGMTTVAELEPLPGVPPTASHLEAVIRIIQDRHVPLLLTSVYFPEGAVRLVKEKTDIRVVQLPHDVASLEGCDTLDAMMETITKVLVP